MNLNDLLNATNQFYADNERSKESLEGYFKLMNKLNALQKKINTNKKAESKLTDEIKDLAHKIATDASMNTEENQNTLRLKRELLKAIKRENEQIETQLEMHKKSNKVLNLTLATISSTEKAVFKLGKWALKNSGYFLDQMRAVRQTEKSMGLLASQTKTFRKTLYEASVNSNLLGVDTKQLAQYQQMYSEALGKSRQLSKDSLVDMTKLQQGTGMSVENMTELLSLTDGMGVNVRRSVKEFEKFSNKASQMGINQVKAYEKINQILKLTNKYNFKNGVDGMKQMALQAERFKVNINEVSTLSDKLFDVEGAIEMGAQLQVLGGKWAQIADPMELMFKARNDMEGLQQSVIEAASGAAQWDKATKTFTISSMEMHRMKEAANATGMSLEHLRDMAIATAKETKIKSQISFNASDEQLALISSLADFKEDGTFTLKIGDKDVNSKDLYRYSAQITQMVKEQETLAKRAEKAQLVDEKIQNTINSFKSMLLPVFEAFDQAVSPLAEAFQQWIGQEENMKLLRNTVQGMVDGITAFGKLIIESPEKVVTGAIIALAGKTIFEAGKYYLMGKQLGAGFNSVASVGGVGGRGSRNSVLGDIGNAFGEKGRRGGRGKYLARAGKSLFKGGGAASLLGLAGDLGLDAAADNGLIDSNGHGYKLGKILASAATWGGTGAMAGTVVPVLGNGVGAAVGAIGGGLYEAYNQYLGKDSGNHNPMNTSQDFIARPNQDPINFSSADTLVGLKKDGGLGKALLNNTQNSGGHTTVDFAKPLEIKGEIIIKGSDGTNVMNLLEDPLVKRELSRIVNEQLSKNLSGGKSTAMNLS